MQKIAFILCLCLVTFQSFSQSSNAAPAVAAKSNAITKVESSIYKKMDYFHIELTHSNWMNTPDSVKIKPLSRGVNTFIAYPMALGTSPFTFTVGLGISVENIYYNCNIKQDSLKQSYFSPIVQTYKMNKLATAYAEAPITLGFKTKPDRYNNSFKINVGLRVGKTLGAHTKYKGNDATGTAVKTKNLLLPNINKYRYEATFSAGYDFIYLVANYSLNTYFTDGKGTSIHPFSIGIGLVGF
jgi:hypothetical protein